MHAFTDGTDRGPGRSVPDRHAFFPSCKHNIPSGDCFFMEKKLRTLLFGNKSANCDQFLCRHHRSPVRPPPDLSGHPLRRRDLRHRAEGEYPDQNLRFILCGSQKGLPKKERLFPRYGIEGVSLYAFVFTPWFRICQASRHAAAGLNRTRRGDIIDVPI